MDIENDHIYTLNYMRVTRKLLPPPFPSKCRDYAIEGYESRLHCVDTCIENNYKKQRKAFPKDLVVSSNRLGSIGNHPILRSIEINCSDHYLSPDCSTETFTLSKMKTIPFFQTNVNLRKDSDETINTEVVEKVSFNDFILYFGDILGLWLGFSIYAGIITLKVCILFSINMKLI